MSIIQTAAASSGSAIVDPTMQAIRFSERPPEVLGSYRLALRSGAMTGTGIADGSPVFGFRFGPSITTNLCMIRKVEISFATTTAFTAAQPLGFAMQIARSWTANQSGGTSAAFTQTNTGKLRASMPTTQMSLATSMIQISSTTLLTGTSYTEDTERFSIVYGPSNGLATGIIQANLYSHQSGDYPLIFASNEGFVIKNQVAFVAGGVINLGVAVEWMELSATSGNVIAY
jgi:hypothetical protein